VDNRIQDFSLIPGRDKFIVTLQRNYANAPFLPAERAVGTARHQLPVSIQGGGSGRITERFPARIEGARSWAKYKLLMILIHNLL
jgi:hypothetical protein